MIKMATLKPDIHKDLNITESKHDPTLPFMKQKGGVSQNFNELRVLPSSKQEYPNLKEGSAFYDKIGCPHIKTRFKIAKEKDHIIKLTISEVLQKRYLDNLTWNMWEIMAKDIGKTKTDHSFVR